MTIRNLHILLTAIFLSGVVSAFAGDNLGSGPDGKAITFRQSFEVDSDKITPTKDLLKFSLKVDSLINASLVGNVNIIGSASIDGDQIQNEILSSKRAMVMKNWFVTSTDIDANKILLFANGEDWELLRQLVESDSDVPAKEEVIKILDSDSSDSHKESSLRKLSGGAVWHYLTQNIFPKMRVATVSLDIFSPAAPSYPILPQTYDKVENVAQSVETVAQPLPAVDDAPYVAEESDFVSIPDCRDQRMALKTNLLYDAALMPSLELEYKINGRWSVALEGSVAWWKNNNKHKYYQIATIIPEVKYHFNPDKGWRGHYLGLFVGGGKYDLENGKKGYQGEGGMAGLSYNYVFNVSRRLSFEAGLGVGAMYTRYKEYIPVNGAYLYQQTKNMWYVGPLRVKFALVWRFWDYNCKGGKR